MPPILEKLSRQAGVSLGLGSEHFNSVNLNWYEDGADRVGWHADDEKLFANPKGFAIASLSLGATRTFEYAPFDGSQRGRTRKKSLVDGSILTMEGLFQSEYQHQVPCELEVDTQRVNLTFRRIEVIITNTLRNSHLG